MDPLLFRHFSWLTLGTPAPAAPAQHRALRAAREHAAEVMPRERLVVPVLIQHLEPVSLAPDNASKVGGVSEAAHDGALEKLASVHRAARPPAPPSRIEVGRDCGGGHRL